LTNTISQDLEYILNVYITYQNMFDNDNNKCLFKVTKMEKK